MKTIIKNYAYEGIESDMEFLKPGVNLSKFGPTVETVLFGIDVDKALDRLDDNEDDVGR